ncbi:MAG: beta-1,6-N-acetylglucosaminyltransferase [Bacteroidales bacterium]|nr:beta-1,6-N-acetylglucosaminyltransferase [Bacteroidales bacterium]
MEKHAYLMTISGNLDVVNTCLRILDNVSNDIYLMFDDKSFPSLTDALGLLAPMKCSKIVYAGLMEINWGGYSQVEATLRLIDNVVNSGCAYSYLHFLQNADLPITANEGILEFFRNHSGKEFVNVDFSEEKWANDNCRYKYFLCDNRWFRKNKIVKAVNYGIVRIQRLLGLEINTDIRFYYGSALFSVTLPFARYLLARRDEIRRRFRRALAPDEKFIQTILMDSPYADNLVFDAPNNSSNAFLIDRTRSHEKNSPHVWKQDELNYLLSCAGRCCFARKFISSEDAEIVKLLEARLAHKVNDK